MKQLVSGINLPTGQEVWRCSCANPPVWSGSRKQAEEQHRQHVAAQSPEKPHPEDEVVEEPDGTVTVQYGFSSRGGQPAHRGEIIYASKAEYEAAVESGLHDKHRLARWWGALASNRGDTVIGEIVDENPHPENALAFVHSVDRKISGLRGQQLYKSIIANPAPFQLLCANDNWIKKAENLEGLVAV